MSGNSNDSHGNDEAVVLQMAQGATDDHKMAALVLATKMGTKTPGFLQKLYTAVGPKFLCKLLDGGSEARGAALPVVATLVTVPEVGRSRGIIEEVCPKVLGSFSGTDEEFSIVEAVSTSSPEAALQLVEGPRLLRVMSSAITSHNQSAKAHKVLRGVAAALCAVTSAHKVQSVRAGVFVEDALGPLFEEAMRVEDRSKFEVLETLCGLLDACADTMTAAAEQRALGRDLFMTWQECARASTAAVLTAKIGPGERCLALRAAQRIVELTGDRWTCAPWRSAECRKCARGLEPEKFAVLLVTSAAVEVRVILGDKTSENVQVFAASIALLEAAAGFLAAEEEEDDDDNNNNNGGVSGECSDSWWWQRLPAESLLYIRGAIVDALGDVLDFLEMCSDDRKEGRKAEGPRELFSMAAVRLLCAWIALDPDGPLTRKAARVLPYIRDYINRIFSPQHAKEMLELLEDY